MTSVRPDTFLDLANRMADAAGEVVRRYFRTPMTVTTKADATPVTVADREAEAAMRRLVEEAHAEHGIMGEEYGSERADADLVWVLDPIDGTRSFITGKPLFGTLIALCFEGRPILGIIDQPISRERWTGAAGRLTTWNGQPAGVQTCAALDQAALYTTGREWYPPRELAAFDRLCGRVKMTQFSADCYAIGLLASGFVDLVVECGLAPFDYCALVPVVEGAGGVISDWQGRPLDLESDGRILAAGDPARHAEALAVLAD